MMGKSGLYEERVSVFCKNCGGVWKQPKRTVHNKNNSCPYCSSKDIDIFKSDKGFIFTVGKDKFRVDFYKKDFVTFKHLPDIKLKCMGEYLIRSIDNTIFARVIVYNADDYTINYRDSSISSYINEVTNRGIELIRETIRRSV